jgi:WS/DGAT/MGAT family acyltransferase
MRSMSGADASYLYMETPTSPMHVVGVLVLEPTAGAGPITRATLIDALEQRIHLIPPLRRRIVSPPAGLDHPVWIEDPDFDLASHIRAVSLPADVTWTDLEAFVGTVAGRLLDRSRPLWEMWVVGGLAGGRVALVTKLHHCIMDGGAGGDLMASLFDLEPGADAPAPPAASWEPDPVPSSGALAVRSLASLPCRLGREAPRALLSTAGGMVGGARTWAAQRARGGGPPLSAPRTALNGSLTDRRSVSLTMVDLDQVRLIRKVFGTTINDVVLAATATSLRSYLGARGDLPSSPLVAATPVSVRVETPGSSELGNKVSNMMVALSLGPDDPVERLRAIHDVAQSSKELFAAFGPDMLQQITGFTAPTLMTAAARGYSSLHLARFHPPVLNLIVSNVAGPPVDLYLGGARVTGVFAMGPLIEGSGLNLTVLSEAHHLNVGIVACPDLVPDVGEIGDGFGEAVAELYCRASTKANT